jgi:hypothetical protein
MLVAKLDFPYTHGNLNTFYAPWVEITDIVGWLILIDNGEGANAYGPDLVSLIVFTKGSDIQPLTIAQLDPMGPEEELQTMGDYLIEHYEIPYEAFLTAYDNARVHVRYAPIHPSELQARAAMSGVVYPRGLTHGR